MDETKTPLVKDSTIRAAEEGAVNQSLERRRRPRINLTQEQFQLSQNRKIFSVLDVSTTGMGIRVIDREDLIHFTVGAQISGMLNILREKIPVSAVVAHVRADQVGCEFRNLTPAVESKLDAFLDPARLGRELRAVPAPDQRAIWYRGPSGTDLLVWRGWDGQITRLSVFILGSFIQWDSSGVATGQILASDENHGSALGVIYFETMLLSRDATVDPGKVSLGRTLISHAELPEDFKATCLRKLNG